MEGRNSKAVRSGRDFVSIFANVAHPDCMYTMSWHAPLIDSGSFGIVLA